MSKKLYVGNLSYSVTTSSLEELFASVGTVASVDVITDRMTGRSRGFAFVEMAEDAGAQRAIAELNGRDLEGRAIKVAEARPRRERRGGGGGYDDRRGGGGGYDDRRGGGDYDDRRGGGGGRRY